MAAGGSKLQAQDVEQALVVFLRHAKVNNLYFLKACPHHSDSSQASSPTPANPSIPKDFHVPVPSPDALTVVPTPGA
jgi:hypothetical protein